MAYSRARRLAQLLSSDGSVVGTRITADAIDGTKIADNAIDSEHYTDGSLDLEHITGGLIQLSSESFADNDTSLMTSAAIQDKILAYGYTTETGDITSVVAGTGLTGGGTSGDVTVNVIAGTGIAANANDVALSHLGIEALADPDADRIFMWDDSAGAAKFLTVSTGLDVTGTTLTNTITQYTTALARATVSVTDAGGDGSLAYNSSTGVITYTGPSASEVRAHLSAGTGVAISSGAISIGQSVATSATPTFGNITTSGYIAGPSSFTIDPAAVGDNTGTVVIAGNLQVDGTTTTINSTTVAIDDLNFSIATDAADSAAANGAGITIGGASATMLYTHATTSWDFNKAVKSTNGFIGDVTGNTSGTAATVTGATQAAITTLANVVTVGTIGTGVWQGTKIASGYIADDAINSQHYAAASIDNEHLADDAVDSDEIAAGAIDLAHMSVNSIDSDQYVDGSIDAAHLAADIITGAKIADDAIDSEHYTDGSIDNAHIADDAIDSEHYTDGSIDTAHLGDDQVTLAKMAGIARGKIIYGDASGNPAVLAVGSSGQALTSDGTDVAWGSGGKTTEEIEDIVGAMVTGNTETRFTATYDDTNAKLDFVGQTIPTKLRVVARSANIDCLVTNAILTVAGRAANISVGVT